MCLADELLIVFTLILLLFEIYAVGMVYRLRKHVEGRNGEYLLRVVLRFGFFVVIAQFTVVVNAILRFGDKDGTYESRLLILLVSQILLAVAFLWTVWEIHHLPVDRYAKNATTPVPEPCECVCKQINDALSPAGAPVDQGDDDTPVAPV